MLNCEILAFIEEIVRQITATTSQPQQFFTKEGNATSGTWLENGSINSNVVGVPFGLLNGVLIKVWVGKENTSNCSVGIYTHDGDEINLNLIHTVSMVVGDGRTKSFNVTGVSIPKDKQIAVRITSGNAKNVKVYLITNGTLV